MSILRATPITKEHFQKELRIYPIGVGDKSPFELARGAWKGYLDIPLACWVTVRSMKTS